MPVELLNKFVRFVDIEGETVRGKVVDDLPLGEDHFYVVHDNEGYVWTRRRDELTLMFSEPQPEEE